MTQYEVWVSTYRLLGMIGALIGVAFQWLAGVYLFLLTLGVVLVDLIGASLGASCTVLLICLLAIYSWIREPLVASLRPQESAYDLFGKRTGKTDWYGWGYLISMGAPIILTPWIVYARNRAQAAVKRNGTKDPKPLRPLPQVTVPAVSQPPPQDTAVRWVPGAAAVTSGMLILSPPAAAAQLEPPPPSPSSVIGKRKGPHSVAPGGGEMTTILVAPAKGSLQPPTNAVYIGPPPSDKLSEGQIYYAPV